MKGWLPLFKIVTSISLDAMSYSCIGLGKERSSFSLFRKRTIRVKTGRGINGSSEHRRVFYLLHILKRRRLQNSWVQSYQILSKVFVSLE